MRGCNKASQNLDEKETLDMINRMKDKKTGSLYHLTSTDFRTEFTPNIFTHCSNSIQGALNATDYKYTHPFLVELRCNDILVYDCNKNVCTSCPDNYWDEEEIILFTINTN